MSRTARGLFRITTLACLLAAAGLAQAQAYRLMLSSRDDTVAGTHVFVATYNSFSDLINSPPVVGGAFSGIDVSSAYQANALVYDGKYRLMLSSRAGSSGGTDLFFATYDTFDDLINSPPVVGGAFSGIEISSAYEASGLAYDGKYRLMLSSRADSDAGTEVFIATYDTFDDLINSPATVGGEFSGIDISPAYQASGLTYDGKYRLMLSSRAASGGGTDVFIATYDTFDDLINSPATVGGQFSGIEISSAYQANGLAFEPAAPTPIPEPGTWMLALAGLGGLAARTRRRR